MKRRFRRSGWYATTALLVLLAGSPGYSDTQICGDFDGSGLAAASDALLVLKAAVGQNVTLQCPVCPGSTTTTTGFTTTTSVTTTSIGATTSTAGGETTTTAGETTTTLLATTTTIGETTTSLGGTTTTLGTTTSTTAGATTTTTGNTTTTLAFVALAALDESQICGDVDGSGSVAASDALLVLKRAVGQNVILHCPGCSGTLTLDAVNSGFYAQTGNHTQGNYAVGWYGPPNDDELRDYFVFNLPPITGTITSAHLHVSTAPPNFIIYGSQDPSETYTLFAVSTELGALTDGSAGASAYDDLAEGSQYGSLVATSALGETVDIELDAQGLAYLANGAGGPVAFGGTITTLAKGATSEFLFNATSAALTRQLVVNVE
jgi:hypothetical protein